MADEIKKEQHIDVLAKTKEWAEKKAVYAIEERDGRKPYTLWVIAYTAQNGNYVPVNHNKPSWLR